MEEKTAFYLEYNKIYPYFNTDIRKHYDAIEKKSNPISINLLDLLKIKEFINVLEEIMTSYERSDSDEELHRRIQEFLGNLPLHIAADSRFWNFLTIKHPKIIKYIGWRWNYTSQGKMFFEQEFHTEKHYKREINRYICSQSRTSIRRHTIARIWWSSKFFPLKLGVIDVPKLLWSQQDTMQSMLEKGISFLDSDQKPNILITIFILVYYEKEEQIKQYREKKIQEILIWLKILESLYYIPNLPEETLRSYVENIFEQVIETVEFNKKNESAKEKVNSKKGKNQQKLLQQKNTIKKINNKPISKKKRVEQSKIFQEKIKSENFRDILRNVNLKEYDSSLLSEINVPKSNLIHIINKTKISIGNETKTLNISASSKENLRKIITIIGIILANKIEAKRVSEEEVNVLFRMYKIGRSSQNEDFLNRTVIRRFLNQKEREVIRSSAIEAFWDLMYSIFKKIISNIQRYLKKENNTKIKDQHLLKYFNLKSLEF